MKLSGLCYGSMQFHAWKRHGRLYGTIWLNARNLHTKAGLLDPGNIRELPFMAVFEFYSYAKC